MSPTLTSDIGLFLEPPSTAIPLPLRALTVASTLRVLVQSGDVLRVTFGISMENVAWCCAALIVRVTAPWAPVALTTVHVAPLVLGSCVTVMPMEAVAEPSMLCDGSDAHTFG